LKDPVGTVTSGNTLLSGALRWLVRIKVNPSLKRASRSNRRAPR
jgi:hypothetical protein